MVFWRLSSLIKSLYISFATFISQATFSAQWPRRSFNSPTSYFSWSKSCKPIQSNTSSLRDYLCNKLLGFGEVLIRCLDAWRQFCEVNITEVAKFLSGSLGSEAVLLWSTPIQHKRGNWEWKKTLKVLKSRSFLWHVYYIFTCTEMYVYIWIQW